MTTNSNDALHTFVIEARALLLQMEESVLKMERRDLNGEAINGIFRAVHTIKGAARVLGLDFVVEISYAAESVLDKVRCGSLEMDATLTTLMLEVCSHLFTLVEYVAESVQPGASVSAHGKEIVGRLLAYLPSASASHGESIATAHADLKQLTLPVAG